MAQKFSFDVVSEVDMAELRNAIDQAQRELATRFDFKGTETSISHDDEETIEVRSSTEDRLKAAVEVLKEKAVKRKVPLKALSEGTIQPGAKASVKLEITLARGISQDKGRELNKFIKGLGHKKVQTQIQGDQLRVTAPKKDDLQAVMQALKDEDFGIPLQFTNYR